MINRRPVKRKWFLFIRRGYQTCLLFFGLHIVVGRYIGNTFSPALTLEFESGGVYTLTVRTKNHLETSFHFKKNRWSRKTGRPKPFWWNSEHLAFYLSKDCGELGERYWRGHWYC